MSIGNRYLALAAVAVSGILLAACGTTSTSSSASSPVASPAATPAATQNIVQIAAGNADLSTLVAAVKAAGLVDTLSGAGPFTVFAPTNEAFAALPAGTLDSLLKPENKDKLVAVLTYHVVPGRMSAKDLMDAAKKAGGQAKLKTVEGDWLTVEAKGSTLSIWDAKGNVSRVTIQNEL